MQTTTFRRNLLIAAMAAIAAIGIAGCGGKSSPQVASLGKTGTGAATTTTLPKGNPTQLLDEWASCMRKNGDPDQTDPTIDANKTIHITYPSSYQNGGPPRGGGGASGQAGPTVGPCGAYLTAASTALRGGAPLPKPDPAKLEKYSRCMRANGIPDFPDPSGEGFSMSVQPGSDLNPNNPTFQKASKLCAKQAGVPGLGGTGPSQAGAIQASRTAPGSPVGGPGGGGAGNQSGIAGG